MIIHILNKFTTMLRLNHFCTNSIHKVLESSPTSAVLTNTMKNLKDRFKNNILVKPLYKKVGKKRKNLLVSINVGRDKLDGDGKIVTNKLNNSEVIINKKVDLPGVCDYEREIYVNTPKSRSKLREIKMLSIDESEVEMDGFIDNGKTDKVIQTKRSVVIQHVTDLWLRVYPLPSLPKESICSVVFRCIVCQLGLASLLVIWTLIWVFAIHFFENPYELKISEDFDREQNQLVIDLATELRQITPLSPRWREAIERRVQEERHLTILAMGEGARINPGEFWNLGGSFLFCVYVMTALGFGAPVPHTIWGRNAALIYAFIAVPTHIYLMVNMSNCLIVNLEICCFRKKHITSRDQESNLTEKPTCNRNSEKVTNSRSLIKKVMRITRLPCACRCVPLALVLYYACGSLAFGVLRGRQPLQVLMFPLEFTTTGGLDRVESYVRILYGIYVEGAMVLLSCALATLRRRSTEGVNTVAQKYRLYHVQRS